MNLQTLHLIYQKWNNKKHMIIINILQYVPFEEINKYEHLRHIVFSSGSEWRCCGLTSAVTDWRSWAKVTLQCAYFTWISPFILSIPSYCEYVVDSEPEFKKAGEDECVYYFIISFTFFSFFFLGIRRGWIFTNFIHFAFLFYNICG